MVERPTQLDVMSDDTDRFWTELLAKVGDPNGFAPLTDEEVELLFAEAGEEPMSAEEVEAIARYATTERST